MLRRRFTLASLLGMTWASAAQRGGMSTDSQQPDADRKLPNGKSQTDEMLKADREKNLKDAAELVDLSQQLQSDIEKNGAFVFSLSTIKKTDDIEKLVKRIRGRMRRY